jgi:hypothetical protein
MPTIEDVDMPAPTTIETATPLTVTPAITPANQFGIIQEYQQPTALNVSLDQATSLTNNRELAQIIFPYPNISSFLYNVAWRRMRGVVSSSGRSSIAEVILDKRFDSLDIEGVNFTAIEKQLAMDIQSPWGGNGWRRDTIIIEVPTGKKPTAVSRRMAANARARSQRHDEVDPDGEPFPIHKIPVHDVRTRSLLRTMLETIQDSNNSSVLRWYGRKDVWQPPYPDAPPERVWGELYTSNAFLDAERDLINANNDSSHPCVIAAFMLWSDSTHLAQFGQAKAWPIYAYLGNQSKYTRCKPSTHSAQVVGYVPPVSNGFIRSDFDSYFITQLPDSFAEAVQAHGVSPTPALLTHCRRELFHAVWRLLLDKEFCQAYEHGITVTCADRIIRRVFPRIFTYSADYPEKYVAICLIISLL